MIVSRDEQEILKDSLVKSRRLADDQKNEAREHSPEIGAQTELQRRKATGPGWCRRLATGQSVVRSQLMWYGRLTTDGPREKTDGSWVYDLMIE